MSTTVEKEYERHAGTRARRDQSQPTGKNRNADGPPQSDHQRMGELSSALSQSIDLQKRGVTYGSHEREMDETTTSKEEERVGGEAGLPSEGDSREGMTGRSPESRWRIETGSTVQSAGDDHHKTPQNQRGSQSL